MNKKLRTLALLLSGVLFACNDEQTDMGFEIQPPEDRVEVRAETFDLDSKTLLLDSMFIKTDTAFLGKYTDEKVGEVKNDFLVQLSCMKNFTWHTEMLGRPDSVALKLYYSSYFGDSLAMMNVVVYELTRKLENKRGTYYTDINPDDYCDYTKVLGEKVFTAANLALSDSIKQSNDYDGPYISIPLDKQLINRFYDNYSSSYFNSTDAFTEFFKGLYVTTTTGDGCILYIDDIYLQFYFKYKKVDENTSVVTDTLQGAATFAYNKEVVLSNRLEQKSSLVMADPQDTVTYIKTPIGAVTQIDVPIKKIKESIGEKTPVNTAKLELAADLLYETEESYMNYLPPYKLLLLPKKELTSFFENGKVIDNKTSYIASYNAQTRKYIFNNLSKLLVNAENDMEEMVLVPVTTYTDTATGLVVKVKPMYTPAIVRLKKKNCSNRPLKLNVIYTNF